MVIEMAANEDSRVQRAHKARSGWVSNLLGLPWKILIVVLVSIIISIVIEWLGIHFQWWHLPNAEHAEYVMRAEMRWLDSDFSRSLLIADPITFATDTILFFHHWLFVKTGIIDWADGGIASTIKIYVLAAVYVTLMTLTRCIILLLTSPLFLLAALTGFVDGLVLRDLRRFGAGRESAFIYHHAKRRVIPVFITGWLIYLSIPFSIHPNLFLVPCAALFGLMITVATSTFKKYL